MTHAWLDEIKWTDDGLVPAVARDADSGEWRKGEESGHVQQVREIRLDCDKDVIVLSVEQIGGIACHTGRRHCFFRRLEGEHWVEVEPVEKSPEEIYGKG
jgi:phosphoribosyl-AMP cyclohydrolase